MVIIITSLISVAFLTLIERKVLGLIQVRLGPNKVGPLGLLQPFSDAVKLYTKEYNRPFFSNKIIFFLFPSLGIFIRIILWITIPYIKFLLYINFRLLFFISLLGIGVYSILFIGWSSNSNYSNIGGIRTVAQTISYEIRLRFIIITLFVLNKNLNFFFLIITQKLTWNLLFLPTFFIWTIRSLAELNRTPFDLSEAESELVSGFNTEFRGGKFALIFISEYLIIIFLSIITSTIFLGCKVHRITFFILTSINIFFIIWIRATLPRIRYDKLIKLTWSWFLPLSLIFLLFIFLILFLII